MDGSRNVTSGAVGFGNLNIQFFDASNTAISTIATGLLGDGSANGGTAEDRFFGLQSSTGISRMEITALNSSDWEIDHVQYGARLPGTSPIPEPSATGVVGALMLSAFALYRLRKTQRRSSDQS